MYRARRFFSTKSAIKKILAANRGDAAIRVFRAASELDMRTVAIFSKEDSRSIHRFKADESYQLDDSNGPVRAYLDIPGIIDIAKKHKVDAIHPGYGFLSENADFAQAVQNAGIVWIGPSPDVIGKFGDKTAARAVAKELGVPMVPGTVGAVQSYDEARQFVEQNGLPVIIKAAFGGGGRGMRVVRQITELSDSFERCSSEAEAAFGNGAVFIERYVERPRHVEVQIVGDKTGNVVHLWERDCSVQRRHQKVVEIAPASAVPMALRKRLHEDAIKLAKAVGYSNAGTVEFLTEGNDKHYFMEVNPRIQVEHTVTEEVTGIDIVQLQIRIARGETLADIGIVQEKIIPHSHAIQCRVTTEDPQENFRPDAGRIEAYRSPGGFGIRLDGSQAFTGAVISPFYDSMLCKVTARGATFDDAVVKLLRALDEFRVRGVSTNITFLKNVLRDEKFRAGNIDTRFIEERPWLFKYPPPSNRGQRLLTYLGEIRVNGPTTPLMQKVRPSDMDPIVPKVPESTPQGWRDILVKDGPKAFADAIRNHQQTLLTDTTMRDAHQSLLATRVRTIDLLNIAPATAHIMAPLGSLECWGGATFDVAMRFLHECPWDRLVQLRELIPNIPFQMLLRGASAVGYTNYADNVVQRFCDQSVKHGMDIFRIFDSLNYIDNLYVGMDCVGSAGGVVEAAVCYTGDVLNPRQGRYNLDYYLDISRKLVEHGTHILGVKDMAGLLTPAAARVLIGALRKEFPNVPIHVHTHDTAGNAVAAQIAAAESGADMIDCCLDSMSGMTSQGSMGAIIAGLRDTSVKTDFSLPDLESLNSYWEVARGLYAPFESNQKSGNSDVYRNEIPGGQYTNLQFQAHSLGLAEKWPEIKHKYEEANKLLGDIVKVTPSSKVVGDLAQFMVQNDLGEKDCEERAGQLDFPSSVTEYLKGHLGQPPYGFREPFRARALRMKCRNNPPTEADYKAVGTYIDRPGKTIKPVDFDALKASLEAKWNHVSDVEVTSAALYPAVFEEYKQFQKHFGIVEKLPTRQFLAPMRDGEVTSVRIEEGKIIPFKMLGCGSDVDAEGLRKVFFEYNGMPRTVMIKDKTQKGTVQTRDKAKEGDPSQIGAPMKGLVVEVRANVGTHVKVGDPLIVLSAMKMEMVISSPTNGVVKQVNATKGDTVSAGDLLVTLTL